jgi:hypothetical protein
MAQVDRPQQVIHWIANPDDDHLGQLELAPRKLIDNIGGCAEHHVGVQEVKHRVGLL